MLVLPFLLFSTCSAEYRITKITTHTIEAFRRQGKANLLKAEQNGEDGAFKLSFTGNITGPTTGEYLLLIEAINYSKQEANEINNTWNKTDRRKVNLVSIDVQVSNMYYGFK